MASLLATGISTLLPQSSFRRTETLKAFYPKSETLKSPILKTRNFNICVHIGGDSTNLDSGLPSKSSSFGYDLSLSSDEQNQLDNFPVGEHDSDDGLEFSFDSDEDNVDSFVTMAVPKKRTSHTKTKIRKNHWKRKAKVAAKKAFSLGKSIATGRSKSFFVPQTTEKPTS